MNRYVLTAQSLITKSWMVRIAILAFLTVSLFIGWQGQAISMVIFFAGLLAGTGFTARSYLQSERRRLVPGMNEACASVSIALLFVSWIICTLLIGYLHSFRPEAIGGCFCGLAFSLWIGCFEKAAFPAILLPYFLPMVAVAYRNKSEKLFDLYATQTHFVHVAAGTFLFAIGIGIVARFWFIITSKYSPFVYRRPKINKALSPRFIMGIVVAAAIVLTPPVISILSHFGEQRSFAGWLQASGICGLHMLISFAICGLLYVFWSGILQYFSPSDRSLTDVGSFLFGVSGFNKWQKMPWIIAGVFLISFAATRVFEGSQDDQLIHSKIGFGLLIPALTANTFTMNRMPKQFSKLWLTGASENRNETATILLLTILARALPTALLMMAVVLTMSMSTTVGAFPTLVVSILSFTFGSVSMWGLTKIYPFAVRHAGFFIIASLALFYCLTVFMISIANDLILNVSLMIDVAGPWIVVLGAVTLTTAISMLCVWDAVRSMSSSSKLMETNTEGFVVVVVQQT